MRKLFVCVSLLVVVLNCTRSIGDTLTYDSGVSHSFPYTDLTTDTLEENLGSSFTLPKFDTSLGTLTQVTVFWESDAAFTYSSVFYSGPPSYVEIDTQFYSDISDGGTGIDDDDPGYPDGAYSAPTDIAGYTTTDVEYYLASSSTDNILFIVDSGLVAYFDNGDGTGASIGGFTSTSAEVTYTYTPQPGPNFAISTAPEPSSLILLSVGATLIVSKRERQLK